MPINTEALFPKSQGLYEAFLENTVEGVLIFNTEGKIVYANSQSVRYTHMPENVILQMSLFDLFFPEDAPFIKESINAATKKKVKFSLRFKHNAQPVVAQFIPLKNQQKKTIYVVGMFMPQNNNAKAGISLPREDSLRFNALANSIPVMIWMADASGKYIYFNKPWLSFRGRKAEYELSNGWQDDIYPQDQERYKTLRKQAFQNKEEFEIEYRLKNKSKKYKWVLDRGVPTFSSNKEFSGYIGSCIDITVRKENEMRLNHLAGIIEFSEDAIYSTDVPGKVLTWNRGAERLFGYKKNEILGKSLKETTIPRQQMNEFLGNVKRVEDGKDVPFTETIRRTKDGRKIDVLMSVSQVKDGKNDDVSVSVIARDITERKLIEKERNELLSELNALIEIAPIGIAFIDSKYRFVKVNREFAIVSGKSVETHLNQTVSKVLRKDIANIIKQNVKKVLGTHQETRMEIDIVNDLRHGEKLWYACVFYPVRLTTNVSGVGVIMQDITEQKMLDKRKDDFISMASHELKTPVTTIKAFTQILQAISINQKEKRIAYLEKIETQVNKLTKIINDLLDISKIRNGMLGIMKEHFEFDVLVEEVIYAFKSIHSTHTITLKGKTSKNIFADRDRIAQVVANLLNNAIKYSPGGKRIVVTLSSDEKTVTVAVRDFGIGIAKKDQQKIFQNFYRVYEQSNSQFPGLGVGLHISSEIIKLHNGTMHVTSKRGKGSTFSFTIPTQ